MAEITDGLNRLIHSSVERFDRIFLAGRPSRPSRRERPLFDRLASVGVTEPLVAGLHAPCVRLTAFQGRFLATDLPTPARSDHVFPLMFEQVYLIRNMDVRPGEDVLELCVGCGANSLFAADVADRVTAVDVSPRALAFARFNEALGAGAVPLDLREGSLFDPVVDGRSFDRILVNPPFEPVPADAPHPLHSNGGEDGLDVVRDLLVDLPKHLAPSGHFVLITWSPGSENEALVTGLCREALPRHRIHLHRLETQPLAPSLEPFAGEVGYDGWRERLASRGLTRLHFVFVHAEPSDAPALVTSHPAEEVAACHRIADAFLTRRGFLRWRERPGSGPRASRQSTPGQRTRGDDDR